MRARHIRRVILGGLVVESKVGGSGSRDDRGKPTIYGFHIGSVLKFVLQLYKFMTPPKYINHAPEKNTGVPKVERINKYKRANCLKSDAFIFCRRIFANDV